MGLYRGLRDTTTGSKKFRTSMIGINTQLAFYLNLYWTVVGPGILSGRLRSGIDLSRILAGLCPYTYDKYGIFVCFEVRYFCLL